jgi:hypothetical protein
MGFEYVHYLSPAEAEPDRDLPHRIDAALRALEVVSAPPHVFDCGRAPDREPQRIGNLSDLKQLPVEADYAWRATDEEVSGIGRLFGADVHGGLVLEVRLVTGPRWKVVSTIGIQEGVALEESTSAHPDSYFDYQRNPYIGLTLPPDAQPRAFVTPVALPHDLQRRQPPADWFNGIFRSCLVLDFMGTFPAFASGEDFPHVPTRAREVIASAFGAALRESFAVM